MAVSRADRREDRWRRVVTVFGENQAPFALDLPELTELAWHDCYGEVTPSKEVVDDMLLLSQGDLAHLIQAASLGVTDWRDLKVAADELRNHS